MVHIYRLQGEVCASFVEFRQVVQEELRITAKKCDNADDDADPRRQSDLYVLTLLTQATQQMSLAG